MKTLIVRGAALLLGAFALASCGSTTPDHERVIAQPPEVAYAALRSFADKIAAKPMSENICADPSCETTVKMRAAVAGIPNETLSFTMLKGDAPMFEISGRFEPGEKPATTRLSIDVTPDAGADQAAVSKMLDDVVAHIDHGQPIPTAMVATTTTETSHGV